ncbi:hypothetical protein [Tardisphaera saccharovorans]
MSFAEKLIKEIKENPDLAEQLKEVLNLGTQREMLAEQKNIKEYLGLLSEEQKKFAEEMMQLREEQVKLREDFNKMAEEQKSMREEMMQLREEQVKLREDFNKMLGELQELHTAQKRTDQKLDKMFSGMIKGFGELSKFAGISFEEFARHFMDAYLREAGVIPKGKSLKSVVIDSEEIDMYCDSPPIVGEVTASATSDEDAFKLLRKAQLVKAKLGAEPLKYLIVLTATRDAYKKIQKVCKENGIELIIGSVVKQ